MRTQFLAFSAIGVVVPLATTLRAQSGWPAATGVDGVEMRVDDQGRRAIAVVDHQAPVATETSALVASNWQALGPFGGDIEDVQVSPIDANLVLAAHAPSSGSGGGLFLSTNGGASWSSVATLAGRSCYDIAFAPDGTAYVGTIDGVWKSTNGGASFTAQNLGIGLNDQVFEIDVDPTNPLRLWCGVADALGNQPVNVMLSVDGGGTWTNKTPPLASPISCTGIAIDPANDQKVYACFGGGFGGGQVWVSTNGGTSWINRSAGLPNRPMRDIVHDGVRVLLCGGQLFGSQTVGLYSTIDDGVVWTPLHDGTWPSLVIHDIGVDPNNASVLLVASAGQGVFRSTDGGSSWAFQVGGTGSLSVNATNFAPGSSTTIFIGSSSNAVWKSTDAAGSFAPSSNGIGALDVYSIGSNPFDEDEIAIAFQGLNNGGVYTTLDGGQSWSLEALPATRFSSVRFTPASQLYAISSGPSTIAAEGLYRRTGASWAPIGPDQGSLYESDLSAMRFSGNDSNLIWASSADFGVAGSEATIWRTVNGGGLWTKVYEGPVSFEHVRDLHVVDPATDSTLVAVFTDSGVAPQTGGALRSIDGGVGWVPASTGLPAGAQCTSLSVSPADPSTLYLSASFFSSQEGVFMSTDAGATWIGTGFFGQVGRVATDAGDQNVVYIAQNGAIKVQVSTNGGATFTPYDVGLAAAGVVRDMRRSLGASEHLLLATSTGAYSTDSPSPFAYFCAGDGTLVTPCPCGNAGGPGRGCENSASTSGAYLAATGETNPDSVVLTSSAELPTATSIFLQGDNTIVSGVVFGDGLRCVGGTLKRLFVKVAIAGIVSAPDFGAGDPSLSQQSANLGDPITTGTTRFYQVYYRDPDLSFCPAPPGNSWNVSSGASIAW